MLDMFAKRDHEAVFAFYDPEIEWDATAGIATVGTLHDLAGVYHGHECVRTFWRRWLQAWMDLEWQVFTVRDGKVVRWRTYPTQEAALEAVGLSR